MKSQDIFLLLKLVALEKQQAITPEPTPFNHEEWIGWEASEETTLPSFDTIYLQRDPYSVRALSQSTGISKSEVANALARCYESGLAKLSRDTGKPMVNRSGLSEFLIYGIRYVFPVKTQQPTRGIATGLTAPVFAGLLHSAGTQLPVWPDPKGNTLGVAVTPLFKTVTLAIRQDQEMYMLLALVDALRLGLPRERVLASELLQKMLLN